MSAIEWTDTTWNPVRGCSRVSEGCRNCYAERMAARFADPGELEDPGVWLHKPGPFYRFAKMTKAGPRWTGKVELVPSKLDEPNRWRKPRRVFVNSMSDLFHEALPDEAIDAVFAVMALTPRHTFQILTKRPERMLRYMTGANASGDGVACRIAEASKVQSQSVRPFALPSEAVFDAARVARGEPWRFISVAWPLPNVWLGVSVEDQVRADERIPLLLQTPAAVRFVSYEPALGPVDLQETLWNHVPEAVLRCFARRFDETTDEYSLLPGLDWVIVGGESGPGARPFDVAWARSVVRQCRKAAVPCFVKQMGARITGDAAGFNVCRWHLDDGRVFVPPIIGPRVHDRPANAVAFSLGSPKGGDPAEWPEDLRGREFPR